MANPITSFAVLLDRFACLTRTQAVNLSVFGLSLRRSVLLSHSSGHLCKELPWFCCAVARMSWSVVGRLWESQVWLRHLSLTAALSRPVPWLVSPRNCLLFAPGSSFLVSVPYSS